MMGTIFHRLPSDPIPFKLHFSSTTLTTLLVLGTERPIHSKITPVPVHC